MKLKWQEEKLEKRDFQNQPNMLTYQLDQSIEQKLQCRIAHSGGKITSNRKEYVEKYISRKGGYENLSEEEKQALKVMKETEKCKPIVKTEKGIESIKLKHSYLHNSI